LNQDFRKVLEKYDKKGKRIVAYLDPPYVKGGDAYNTTGVTPEEVCNAVKKLRYIKAVISYDIHPRVKRACKGLRFRTITVPYSAGNKRLKKKEYLITNF